MRNIDPEGLATQDGRLRRGDEILDVNGKSLKDCTHKKAAGIIRVREKQEYNIIASAMKLSQFSESKQNHKYNYNTKNELHIPYLFE